MQGYKTWGRKPGRGVEVSTDRGEKIRGWFHRRSSHERGFGLAARAVLFADSRSGWSAVQLTVNLIWWTWTLYPIRWRNGPREDVRVVSLAEQVRETHRQELRMTSADDKREEQEAKEREALRKKQSEIMAEIRRRRAAEQDADENG